LTSCREFESIEYLQQGKNKALNKRKEGLKERGKKYWALKLTEEVR
jgi:hypothetical protein